MTMEQSKENVSCNVAAPATPASAAKVNYHATGLCVLFRHVITSFKLTRAYTQALSHSIPVRYTLTPHACSLLTGTQALSLHLRMRTLIVNTSTLNICFSTWLTHVLYMLYVSIAYRTHARCRFIIFANRQMKNGSTELRS